jgi:multidrug transporter EmrE-like cation transporter
MNTTRIVAIVLIVAGVLGLVYGSFSYTKEETQAKIGPFELKVENKETVNVPIWASIGAIVAGAVLLFVGRK